MHTIPNKNKKREVKADIMKWSNPDHNKEINIEYNGMYGSITPSGNMFEWSLDSMEGENVDSGVESTLNDAKKVIESILKEHKGFSKCRSCGKEISDSSGLCDTCYKAEAELDSESVIGKVKTKTKTKSIPAVDFTERELDSLLSQDAIDQEIKKMHSKGVLPSQKYEMITADVVDAVRWQEAKEKELKDMDTADTQDSDPWVSDLAEDFITFGVSPSHTKEEAKIILENMDESLKEQAAAGFGAEARNYISTLRKELELIIEKL